MVTVMLVNFRDNILEVGSDREELLARLARLPSQIEADDIPDLVTLAQVYSSRLKRVDNEFFFFIIVGDGVTLD